MSTRYPKQSASHARAGQSTSRRRHIGAIVAFAYLLSTAILLPGAALAQGTPAPFVKAYYTDNNGNPCASCLLTTFAAGTTTPLATYSDAALITPNSNPIVLDSSGRATIYLSATSYKFRLRSADAVTTYWTQDNVPSVAMSANSIGFELAVLGGDPNVAIVATSYPSGTSYSTAHAGTLLFTFNSANVPPGTYALEGMLLASGGTVTAALVNLSDGAPDTAMVTIASTSATGERQISSGITFAAAGASKSYAVKVKVSAGYGFVWVLRLVRLS